MVRSFIPCSSASKHTRAILVVCSDETRTVIAFGGEAWLP